MEIESYIRQAGKVDKWVVQFRAPCLVQWKFNLPWVRALHHFPLFASACHQVCTGLHINVKTSSGQPRIEPSLNLATIQAAS